MPQLQLTLSTEWLAKLQAIADEQDVTLEAVVRHCMEKGYDFCFGDIATQLKDGVKRIEDDRRSLPQVDISAVRARSADLKAKWNAGDAKNDG